MRPAEPPPRQPDAAYLAELRGVLQGFGVTHLGVADASVLHRAREALHHRLEHDLTDGMQFTFRNPERSTDPQAAVKGAQSVLVAARPYLLDPPEQQDDSHPVSPTGRIARYAWAESPDCNLYNAEGLPASPFRTDDWPGRSTGVTRMFIDPP